MCRRVARDSGRSGKQGQGRGLSGIQASGERLGRVSEIASAVRFQNLVQLTSGLGPLPFVAVKLAGNPFDDYCLSIQYP